MKEDRPFNIAGKQFYDFSWSKWTDMKQFGPMSRHVRRLSLSILKRLNFMSVLDAGCGEGSFLNALQGGNFAKDIKGDQDMSKECAHCGSEFYEPKTMIDKVNFDAMQKVRVGCSKCGTSVCFSCAATAADQRGKEGNCFCPKCGAELGRKGEAGELGKHFSGWS